ncbi:hypothetical protein TI04_00740 [Achromatium sp. WMS2]|nr:hypothetical protein TI04_00740 [Achromatium sp. WMS2]
MSVGHTTPPPVAVAYALPKQFNILRLDIELRALEQVHLPEFAGSTVRGALGQALHRIVCLCNNIKCQDCALQPACWYARLYEPAPVTRCPLLHQGYTDAPIPFVPEIAYAGNNLSPGMLFKLGLVLFGKAQAEAIPFLIQAVERLGAFGLGRGRGKLELVGWSVIEQWDPDPWQPPELCTTVKVILHTPLRLRVDNRIVSPEHFEFRPFFMTLLRRLSLLTCCYGNTVLELDFKGLARQTAQVVVTERNLRWLQWARYTTTQKRYVDMDGLIGEFYLDLSKAQELYPYLWVGQWLHVGKGASMGMGGYSLCK